MSEPAWLEKELELGRFTIAIQRAREINRASCRKHRIYFEGHMTPQEALFAELFNHEKILVKDMDTLSLRAHREELVKIAFEARARLSAVDEEERSRRAKKDGKPTGFERNLDIDDVSRDAINTVKERQKKLTKMERVMEGLKKLGVSDKDAESMVSAGTIHQRLKKFDQTKTEGNSGFINPFKK